MRTLESILDIHNNTIADESAKALVDELSIGKNGSREFTDWSVKDDVLQIDNGAIYKLFPKPLLNKINTVDIRGGVCYDDPVHKYGKVNLIKGGYNVPSVINCEILSADAERIEDITLCGCARKARSGNDNILIWGSPTTRKKLTMKNVYIPKTNQWGMNMIFMSALAPDLRGLTGNLEYITIAIYNKNELKRLEEIFNGGDISKLEINQDLKVNVITFDLSGNGTGSVKYILHSKQFANTVPFGKFFLKRVESK